MAKASTSKHKISQSSSKKDARLSFPKIDIEVHTEHSEYHITNDTNKDYTGKKKNISDSVISFQTKNSIGDEIGSFSVVLAGAVIRWDKIINSNDIFIIRVDPNEMDQTTPVYNTNIMTGLVTSVERLNDSTQDSRMYQINGQSFQKVFTQYKIGLISQVEQQLSGMGWLWDTNAELTEMTSDDGSDSSDSVSIGKYSKSIESKAHAVAEAIGSKLGINAGYVYGQIYAETSFANTNLAKNHNNLSGITISSPPQKGATAGAKQPDGNAHYAYFKTLKDYANAYMTIIKHDLKGEKPKSLKRYIHLLALGGYFAPSGESTYYSNASAGYSLYKKKYVNGHKVHDDNDDGSNIDYSGSTSGTVNSTQDQIDREKKNSEGVPFFGSNTADIEKALIKRFKPYIRYSYDNNTKTIWDFMDTTGFQSWSNYEYLMDSSTFSNASGSLYDLQKAALRQPFNEMFFESMANGKSKMVIRRQPFNPEDWKKLSVATIDGTSIVDEKVGKTDAQQYSVFVVNPAGVTIQGISDGMLLSAYPQTNQSLIDKYGYSKYEVDDLFLSGKGDNSKGGKAQKIDTSNKSKSKKKKKKKKPASSNNKPASAIPNNPNDPNSFNPSSSNHSPSTGIPDNPNDPNSHNSSSSSQAPSTGIPNNPNNPNSREYTVSQVNLQVLDNTFKRSSLDSVYARAINKTTPNPIDTGYTTSKKKKKRVNKDGSYSSNDNEAGIKYSSSKVESYLNSIGHTTLRFNMHKYAQKLADKANNISAAQADALIQSYCANGYKLPEDTYDNIMQVATGGGLPNVGTTKVSYDSVSKCLEDSGGDQATFMSIAKATLKNVSDEFLRQLWQARDKDNKLSRSKYNEIVKGYRNAGDTTNDNSASDLKEFTRILFNWYADNFNMYSGDIATVGNPDFRVGMIADIIDSYEYKKYGYPGMRYYIESVTHTFSFVDGYKSLLGVTRGMKRPTATSNDTRFSNLWGKSVDYTGGYMGEATTANLALAVEISDSDSSGSDGAAFGGKEGNAIAVKAAKFGYKFRKDANPTIGGKRMKEVYALGGHGERGSKNPLKHNINQGTIVLDCSSFIHWCFNAVGANVPSTTTTLKADSSQFSTIKIPRTSTKGMKIGDLVEFHNAGHVMFYIGGGELMGWQGGSTNASWDTSGGCQVIKGLSAMGGSHDGYVLRYK